MERMPAFIPEAMGRLERGGEQCAGHKQATAGVLNNSQVPEGSAVAALSKGQTSILLVFLSGPLIPNI